MVKFSGNRLKMSSGDNFERVAQAYKHGWRPSKIRKFKSSKKTGKPKKLGESAI